MAQANSGVALELRLLGPLDLRRDSERVAVGGAKPRALLAVLALELGRVVSVDRLVEELWSEGAPDSALHAVEVYVSQVRKALGPARAVLERRGPGYALQLEPDSVDLHRFARLVEERAYREALSLWRGSALADFTYEPFAQVEIARLEELRQRCLEGRIEEDLALGRHAELTGELEALVAAEPLRERLRALLMLALYRSGRQADALEVYRAARETLVEELGIEPGPELRELQQAILRQDQALLLARAAAPASEPAPPKRKLVSILFADLVDSMKLAAQLDAEAFHALLGRYFETVVAIVERHGGTVEKFAGDAAMAAFGIPVAHEDDALRAARAALELQSAAATLELELRIGVESGEVLAGDPSSGQRFVTGESVGIAARLQQLAPSGGIAVGERAARLIAHAAVLEPLPPLELHGHPEPLRAFRLVELAAAAPSVERRLETPLVGRKRELRALRAAVARAIASKKARSLLVAGPAGIGKSRLAEELAREAEALVLRGGCLSYGEGITYWPLRTMLPEEELEPILAAPSAGEIAWAFRRRCEELAAERPLVLVFDDLHWAEPTLLDLVEHLAERAEGPILVLALARDELLETRPAFLATGRLVLDALEPVDAATLLAGRALPDPARDRIVDAAEGNPLFLEQLAAFAAEEDGFAPERQVPETIQALLAARLDRLGPGERAVLERAAVIGKEFGAAEVTALLEPAAAGTIGRHLETLTGRGFVRSGVEEEFRFRHGLIQDAVYRATPKTDRAALHEQYADQLGQSEELDEIVGYHLERAYRLRRELGADDRSLRQLARDAGTRLAEAGIRAEKRHDIPAAVSLLQRATALEPPDRAQLNCELAVVLDVAGATADATALLEETLLAAQIAGDARVESRARFELAYVRLIREPSGAAEELIAEAEAAIPALEALHDERALGRAWLLLGFATGALRGRYSAWEDAARRAVVHYQRAGWPAATCLGQLAAALYYGPTPARQAIEQCEKLLADGAGRTVEAHLHIFSGGLEAMRGRFEAARAEIAEGKSIYDELGQLSTAVVYGGAVSGEVELLAGDFPAAEQTLTEVCALLTNVGNKLDLSIRAADLAEALYCQGRYEEAETWAATAAANAAPESVSAQLLWRSISAKLLARRGDVAVAEARGREALAHAERTEALNRRARVLIDLSEVVSLAGRPDEGRELAVRAARLYRRKGNVAAATRIDDLTRDLAPA